MPKEDTLVVHEIYGSVQGESSFAGMPCTFVRLTGCNLRCSWCDTPQAFHGGERMSRSEVTTQVKDIGLSMVELTGGEPLLQPAAIPLLKELCDDGLTVLLETSGERDISAVDPRVHRIVDFKAPGSGESQRNRWANVDLLTAKDEVKFVLADRADYDWAKAVVDDKRMTERVNHVLFSAVHGQLSHESLVEWIVQDKLSVRFQLQMHKVIWDPDATGV